MLNIVSSRRFLENHSGYIYYMFSCTVVPLKYNIQNRFPASVSVFLSWLTSKGLPAKVPLPYNYKKLTANLPC